MERYKNLGQFVDNPSNIVAYELGNECIDLVFGKDKNDNNMKYTYLSSGVGAHNMVRMHELARAGQGLLAFINTTPEVKTGYDSKEIYVLAL